MEMLTVSGPNRLSGEVTVHGAKNSTLPLLAASLLCREPALFHDCPALSDVYTAVAILKRLGCGVVWEGSDILVDPETVCRSEISDALMREMRSSIVFLGAMVSRTGYAELSTPGGCELGPRPIDLHLEAFRKMGMRIEEDHGFLHCTSEGRLSGCPIHFSFPSVGATENVLIAASVAKGTTILSNAAREPEIVDLANFINCCGGRIRGAGGSTIVIEGVRTLHGCEYTVIPDRIEAATYMAAAVITGSSLLLRNVVPAHLYPVMDVFEEAGCTVCAQKNSLSIQAPGRLRRLRNVRTMPYPGFPTDAQAPVMAMASLAEGTSLFVETVFESRYQHVAELARLGANIKVEGRVAVVEGVPKLSGALVEAPDLRGGAALVLAGLAAEGTTGITGVRHLDRGYAGLETTLQQIGADIRRVVIP